MIRKPVSSTGEKPVSLARRERRPAPSVPTAPPPARPSGDVRNAARTWLSDGKCQGWSTATIRDRTQAVNRFCWWLEHEAKCSTSLAVLTPDRLREFLAYARAANPSGRFGSPRPSAQREARPATVNAYYRILRAFTNFCIAEGHLAGSPLKNVKEPKVPKDQIEPFSTEQVQALLDGARRGNHRDRDLAVLYLLLDTGMRESELAGLKMAGVNRGTGSLRVLGMGNKARTVHMGQNARRALWRHLEYNRRDADPDEALFVSEGGFKRGEGLQHTGIYRIVRDAGKRGRVSGLRCSPHTCRHTFAINFLRNGGNLIELQELMGHEDLTVLRRYVKYAQQDLAQAHRQASPMDHRSAR